LVYYYYHQLYYLLVTFTTKIRQAYLGFKNNESRLNHHLSGLLGVSSLAWTGHLVHAFPVSRGVHIGWDNFLQLTHPEGLTPFLQVTGQHTLKSDSANHVYGTSKALVLQFNILRWFPPSNSIFLWLSDMHIIISNCSCFHCCWSYVSNELRYWS
jgi:photosystem I P700 chlorophyll a apoprotein A2